MKNMIFNFSTNKQFSTNIEVNGEVIQTVSEAKLLGTIISEDLKWKKIHNIWLKIQTNE